MHDLESRERAVQNSGGKDSALAKEVAREWELRSAFPTRTRTSETQAQPPHSSDLPIPDVSQLVGEKPKSTIRDAFKNK